MSARRVPMAPSPPRRAWRRWRACPGSSRLLRPGRPPGSVPAAPSAQLAASVPAVGSAQPAVGGVQTAVKNAGHSATLLVQHDAQQSIVTITLQ